MKKFDVLQKFIACIKDNRTSLTIAYNDTNDYNGIYKYRIRYEDKKEFESFNVTLHDDIITMSYSSSYTIKDIKLNPTETMLIKGLMSYGNKDK